MEVVLPKNKISAQVTSPKNFMFFGPPKVGKTTKLSELDNCLILDLENGTDYIEALKINVPNLKTLKAIGEKIKENGKPYKYVAIDTVTKLEEMCMDYALHLYRQTSMGRTYEGKSIIDLPKGAGYPYLWQAVKEMVKYVSTMADRMILVGHVKEKLLDYQGTELSSKSLDLTGKLATILAADSDALGYTYRDKEGNLCINFASSESVVCGTRCNHLKGYNGVFDWSKIYID